MSRKELERARAHWRYRGSRRPEWAIEPGPGQESVWDYPRPPRIDGTPRIVQVRQGRTVIAETSRAVRVLETASPPTIYVPPEDVRTDLLARAPGASVCEWKGSATYWSLIIDGCKTPNVAWSYEQPFPEFEALRDYISFYPAKLECYVDGQRAKAQVGGFYGGWVTPDVVGPFKGQAGTGTW